jgi:hypothetical protein
MEDSKGPIRQGKWEKTYEFLEHFFFSLIVHKERKHNI